MNIEQIVEIIWMASAILLIVFVLLHSPKNDGIGLGGSTQFFTSAKTAEQSLNRLTWALGLVFLGTGVILSAGWLSGGAPETTSSLPEPTPQVAPEPQKATDPALAVPEFSDVPSIPNTLGPES